MSIGPWIQLIHCRCSRRVVFSLRSTVYPARCQSNLQHLVPQSPRSHSSSANKDTSAESQQKRSEPSESPSSTVPTSSACSTENSSFEPKKDEEEYQDVFYSNIPSVNEAHEAYIRNRFPKLSYKKVQQGTLITMQRVLNDYFLTPKEIETLKCVPVRSAYDTGEKTDFMYLKSDVEAVAASVWGSLENIRKEKQRRMEFMQYDQIYSDGLQPFSGNFKKAKKDESKRVHDKRLFGGSQFRMGILQRSQYVVMAALGGNLTILSIKLGAYLLTGSASILAEMIHSFADAANQAILLVGISKSLKEPSPDHPYGWHRAPHIFALISAVSIFCIGCGVSVYRGIDQLIHPSHLDNLPMGVAVLCLSAVIEGATMLYAYRQVSKSAKDSGVSLIEYLKRGRDPNAVAVMIEDSAAFLGIITALSSIFLCHHFCSSIPDAMGSLVVGSILGGVAMFLIHRNYDFLVGRSIHPDRLRQIVEVLEEDIVVRSIHDVKATELGGEMVRFKAEVNFDGREIARIHLSRVDVPMLLESVKKIKTVNELEAFMLDHGEFVIDVMGAQVDRLETKIKKTAPEVRHIDLEIL